MSQVTLDWGKFKGLLRDGTERGIQLSIDRQNRQIEKALTREKVANQVRGVLGEIPELKPYERETGRWGPAASKLSDTLRTTWGEMSMSDDPKADAVFDLFRELHDVIDESEIKSEAQIEKEHREGEQDILKKTETYAKAVQRAVEGAIRRAENWGGEPVRIKVRVPWDADMGRESITGPSDDFSVYVGAEHMAPDFTVFTNEGKIVGIDDVLEAGDREFFPTHKPHLEMDYFNLVRELKHPGSTRKEGKNLTLWTARPTKDRHLYQGAKHVPTNIFLTTDMHRASGIAHDLGAGEVRDVWKMVINEKYLMKTLEAGHIRDYQTIGKKQVPVVRTVLVSYGESMDFAQAGEALGKLCEEMGLESFNESKAVLHWVKQKFGAAKAAAHRAFLKMVRKDPAAHRRKMRSDKLYHQRHKWHDAIMRKTSRPGWARRRKRSGLGEEANPDSMQVQTLIFKKSHFSRESAVEWAKSHDFKVMKVDETEESYRIRQRDPGEFEIFRTISFKPGLKAVVAKE